jgi:arginyl-tRNA synthetase
MILPVHDRLSRAPRASADDALFTRSLGTATLALEYPPNRDLGDLGTPVAFELARRLRKPPASDSRRKSPVTSARSKASRALRRHRTVI